MNDINKFKATFNYDNK